MAGMVIKRIGESGSADAVCVDSSTRWNSAEVSVAFAVRSTERGGVAVLYRDGAEREARDSVYPACGNRRRTRWTARNLHAIGGAEPKSQKWRSASSANHRWLTNSGGRSAGSEAQIPERARRADTKSRPGRREPVRRFARGDVSRGRARVEGQPPAVSVKNRGHPIRWVYAAMNRTLASGVVDAGAGSSGGSNVRPGGNAPDKSVA